MHDSDDPKSNWSLWWNKDKYSWLNLYHCEPELKKTTSWTTAGQSKDKAKLYQAPTHLRKLHEKTIIESEARTTVVQLKSKA